MIVGFRPDVFVCLGVDELHVDPNLIADLLDASFDDTAHAEFAADLRDAGRNVRVALD